MLPKMRVYGKCFDDTKYLPFSIKMKNYQQCVIRYGIGSAI